MEGKEINLRSFGSLLTNYAGWCFEGQHQQALTTKKWKSVTGPVLVMGKADSSDIFILDKLVPGPLYLYLSLNEVLNYCKKYSWPDLKAVLHTVVGVQVHVYQGKIGNYEGPNIQKILRKLDSLEPHMTGDHRLYYNALLAFKKVAHSVFGAKLHPSWREHLHILRDTLHMLTRIHGMPITPKLHVLTVHVEQWIDIHGRSMGKEGESSGESLHHLWKRMLEGQGKVKEKESDLYVKIMLDVVL